VHPVRANLLSRRSGNARDPLAKGVFEQSDRDLGTGKMQAMRSTGTSLTGIIVPFGIPQ